MKPFNKVLLIRPRFLGDLILTTGLAEVFHQENPKAEVWVLTEKVYAEALQNHPGLAGVLSFDFSRKNNPFYLLAFYRDLRKHQFDVVLDLFCNLRTAFFSFFSGAPVRVGFEMRGRSWAYNVIAPPSSEPLPSDRRSVVEAFLDQARALGLKSQSLYKTSLGVTEGEKAYVMKLFDRAGIKPDQKVVAITPGASWPAKHWPLERFIELGFWLKRAGVRPLYLFGPKEVDLVQEFEAHMDKDWLLINQPNIRGLMAFIEGADALVANDSGPMHVGPAVGTPTLGLFGPGEPEIWFPYGKPHELAYAEVGCSHCGLDDCSLMACMDHLEVKDIAHRVLALIGQNPPKSA
jgi:lipopolysaccharide heptosyltransferase II